MSTSNIIILHLNEVQTMTIAIKNILVFPITTYNITTHCREKKVLTEYNYTCPESYFIITHHCRSKQEVFVSYCPPLRNICNMINMTNGIFLGNSSQCRLTKFTQTYTYCTCSIHSFISPIEHRRHRKLVVNEAVEDSGALSLSSMALYEFKDITTTLNAASSLNSAEAVEKSLIVMMMFLILWSSGVAVIASFSIKYWYSKSVKKVQDESLLTNSRKNENQDSTNDNNGKLSDYMQIHDQLVAYIRSSFPYAFQDIPFFQRMTTEIWNHHKYIALFSSLQSKVDFKVCVQGIQIVSFNSFLMFLLAVFYDLQDPGDDGSCINYIVETDCLSKNRSLTMHNHIVLGSLLPMIICIVVNTPMRM